MVVLVKKLDWENPTVQIHFDYYEEILLSINLSVDYTEAISLIKNDK